MSGIKESVGRLAAIGLATAGTIALVLPQAASAASPRVHSKTIVPGVSLAGISVGMKYTTAIKLWGGGPSTCGKITASYGTCSFTEGSDYAELDWRSSAVTFVEIMVKSSSTKVLCAGPLLALKTIKGIGLCSTRTALVKAYPAASFTGSGLTLGSGRDQVSFEDSAGTIDQISIGNGG